MPNEIEKRGNAITKHLDLNAKRHGERLKLVQDLRGAISKRAKAKDVSPSEMHYLGEAVHWFTNGIDNIHDTVSFMRAMRLMEAAKKDWPRNKSSEILDKFKKKLEKMHELTRAEKNISLLMGHMEPGTAEGQ